MARVIEKKKKEKKVESIIVNKTEKRLFLLGLILLVVGYVVMAQPPVYGFLSLHLAPIILIIAYLIVFPLAIMYRGKESSSGD